MKETPQHWDLLCDADKTEYSKLQSDFQSGTIKKSRNGRVETFEEILEEIRRYCVKEENKDDEWKRYLVCGICWMEHAIAINTRQLKLLICKCKSSINGSLQKMGYTTNMAHSESWKILFPKIPLLKDHYSELRKWTIRYKPGYVPDTPAIPENAALKNDSQKKPKPKKSEAEIIAPPIQESTIEQRIAALPTPSVPLKFRRKMSRILGQEVTV